jgi:hypothetical protein
VNNTMAMKAKDLPVKETAMQGLGQGASTVLRYLDHNRIQEWVDVQTYLPTDPVARREAIMKQFPIYMRWRACGSAVGLLVAGVVMDNENRLVITPAKEHGTLPDMNLEPDSERMFVKVQYVSNARTRIFRIFIVVGRLVIRIGIAGAEEKPKPERRRYDLVKYCVECVIRNWGPLMFVWGILFGM